MPAYPGNLAPHVRELKTIAGTGCGKTKFAANLAAPDARKILERCVGKTNSTILDRLVIFTTDEDQRGRMTVAVRHNSSAIPYSAFQELLTSAAAGVVQKVKSAGPDEEKNAETMREALETELGKKNNLKAVFSLLPDKERAAFLSGMTEWYRSSRLWEDNARLYNTAKNQSQDQNPGKTSASLLGLIKTAVRDWLDQCPQDQKDSLQDIYAGVNGSLSRRFFDAFPPDHRSADGYYYRSLDLRNPDEVFCRQMFTSNNMQSGETLSLEVLCSEIVIYVPMAAAVADMLRQIPAAERVFSDPRSNLVFGLRDTQGLFHADRDEDENVEYCADLVYKNAPDAILVIVPLEEDANGKKALELYRQIMQSYQKDTPIFLIHNKLDLFVDSLVKEQGEFDPLTGQSAGNAAGLTLQEVRSKIQQRIEELDGSLRAIQKKGGKRLNIHSAACFLKELNNALSPDVQKGIFQSYNLLGAYRSIFASLAGSLERNAGKIAFEIDPSEEQAPNVDAAQLQALVHTHLNSPEVQKLVFDPGAANLVANYGITPHGNSYYALGRRLRNGDSFKSDINEDYYYNCKNIAVTFPANIKNLLSSRFLHTLVFKALTLKGGTFRSRSDEEQFLKAAEEELCAERYQNELIAELLYNGAFLKAGSGMAAFSFRQQFQAFLDYSGPLLTPAKLDESVYAEALRALVEEAGRVVMSRRIIFV